MQKERQGKVHASVNVQCNEHCSICRTRCLLVSILTILSLNSGAVRTDGGIKVRCDLLFSSRFVSVVPSCWSVLFMGP